MKSIAFITLGCKLNQYESVGMQEQFNTEEYVVVAPESGADYYIVNTCTVTSKTDRRSRHAVRRIVNWNPNAKIIVTGCGAQRDSTEFLNLPNVILVAGNREKNHIRNLIEQTPLAPSPVTYLSSFDDARFDALSISQFGKYTRAFIKIQEGCERKCSYCVIPAVRGPSRSQQPELVLAEITRIVLNGFKEIVLTGIDLGAYGLDLNPSIDLSALLAKISLIPNLERIRLSSIEPTERLSDLLTYLVQNKKICRHLHIPLQSGCNEILTLMGRNYTTDDYAQLIARTKRIEPDVCIGTDVIVAFPGETPELFQKTYSFVESLDIDYLHVFTYSPRKNTAAAGFQGKIEPPEAKKRCHAMRALSLIKANAFRKKLIGCRLNSIILASEDKPTGMQIALTDNYVKVLLRNSSLIPGTLVDVVITEVEDLSCVGQIII
jgi:threonylcarbamoyladenosine tRNA methylthiotransferase MtaB